MRPLIIAGVVVLSLGAFVLLRGASFTSRRDVIKVADVKITADEQHAIPPWVGVVAVVTGVVLIGAGVRKRG